MVIARMILTAPVVEVAVEHHQRKLHPICPLVGGSEWWKTGEGRMQYSWTDPALAVLVEVHAAGTIAVELKQHCLHAEVQWRPSGQCLAHGAPMGWSPFAVKEHKPAQRALPRRSAVS